MLGPAVRQVGKMENRVDVLARRAGALHLVEEPVEFLVPVPLNVSFEASSRKARFRPPVR